MLKSNELKMLGIMSMAGLSYDYDKDVPVITKPDFHAYSGMIEKHTYDKVVVLKESIKSLFHAAKLAEDEAKALAGKNGAL